MAAQARQNELAICCLHHDYVARSMNNRPNSAGLFAPLQ